MNSEKNQPSTNFHCAICQFSTHYDYRGNKPPFSKGIVLLEDAYVIKDPFSPERGGFMVIGGKCSFCQRTVCCNQKCSMFYSKRFCMDCCMKHVEEFPDEIKLEMTKISKLR